MSIKIVNLYFSYGAKHVLRDICLSVEPAETLAVLGPNGSGKTTLLSAAAGLLTPSSGSIVFDGKTPAQLGARRMARLVGYVPQSAATAFDYRVIDYVVTGCAPQIGTFQRPGPTHMETAMGAIRDMGIEHLAEKSYKRLSGGERQQVSIARALAQRPAYILMDEPTSHLDYGNQIHVLKTIRRLAESGFGVVFTTHNPDQALLIGGKAAVLDRSGRLVCGDSRALMDEASLSELYGVELRITSLAGTGRRVCFAPGLDETPKKG